MAQLIDSNCMVGPTVNPVLGREFSAEILEKEMDLAEVQKAVVHHALAKEHHPAVGNAAAVEIARTHPRLLPAWVLLPHQTKEMEAPERVVERMVESGVVLAKMFPADHNFSLSEWSCGPVLSALEERRMPLMIDLTQTTCDQVAAICTAHPGLPVILADVGYRTGRFIYALLGACPNLRIETSRYQAHRGIESLCREFGAERLIFGSRSPDLACGPTAMAIRYARISKAEKDKILGGNFEALMRGIRG